MYSGVMAWDATATDENPQGKNRAWLANNEETTDDSSIPSMDIWKDPVNVCFGEKMPLFPPVLIRFVAHDSPWCHPCLCLSVWPLA